MKCIAGLVCGTAGLVRGTAVLVCGAAELVGGPTGLVGEVLACSAPSREHKATPEVIVAAGAALQIAIDACPPGGVIRLAEGVYPERILIDKPLTLIGAGWDKTVVGSEDLASTAPAVPSVPNARNGVRDGSRAAAEPAALSRLEPTLTVRNAREVVLRGLRIRGPRSTAKVGSLTDESLVVIDAASATISECAVLGPSMNGIAIRAGSEVRIERSLVAALWGTGVQVLRAKEPGVGAPARVQIVESDIRNCYHRGVTIAGDDVLVERCRISGSAWHGIRYDGCSPTVRANQIFLNARSGIYASGDTAAHVSDNVFWKNEMNGMSCWFKNADSIEGNTFVGNLREAIAVLGDSRPKLARNVFADNPIAVFVGQIADGRESGSLAPGELALSANLFWANPVDYKITDQVLPLPAGNDAADPGFVSPRKRDFALAADSVGRRIRAGAADPISLASPFPVQPEEKAMIPESEARGFQLWKH